MVCRLLLITSIITGGMAVSFPAENTADAVMKQYRDEVVQAEAKYEAEIKAAKEAVIAKLKSALANCTKTGDKAGAAKINGFLAEVDSGAKTGDQTGSATKDREPVTTTDGGTKALAKPTPFTAVVREHFSDWDHDGENALSDKEIDELVVNAHIKGDSAAAVAVLKGLFRFGFSVTDASSHKSVPAKFTLQTLADYERAVANKEKLEHNFDASFQSYRRKLFNMSHEVFAHDLPHLESVQQGSIGDCYFIACLGAYLAQNPKNVCQMILSCDAGNKSFTVHFGREAPILLRAPTEVECALDSTSGDDGQWLAILEKAYGVYQNRKNTNGAKAEEPTDTIAKGGFAGNSIQLLTGHAASNFQIQSGHTANNEAALREKLLEHCNAKKLIAASASTNNKAPPGMYNWHCYAVLEYDHISDTVKLWNPHGQDFSPKGPPGPNNGYLTKKGLFTMTLADFASFFTCVQFEEK